MKLLILFVLVALAAARPDENHYDTKYDNFNIEEVITNKRLMHNYCLCFVGEGKCTSEGNDFKKAIPEGTKTSCAKCSPKQKVMVAKFIGGMQEQCPKEWEIIKKREDPEGKYQDELKKFVEEYSH